MVTWGVHEAPESGSTGLDATVGLSWVLSLEKHSMCSETLPLFAHTVPLFTSQRYRKLGRTTQCTMLRDFLHCLYLLLTALQGIPGATFLLLLWKPFVPFLLSCRTASSLQPPAVPFSSCALLALPSIQRSFINTSLTAFFFACQPFPLVLRVSAISAQAPVKSALSYLCCHTCKPMRTCSPSSP